MERWRDRVALVTGASAGIGLAVARNLAEAKMRVAVCARRKDRLDALADAFPEDRIATFRCDLRNESEILEMFEGIRATWHGIDVLVNNAGLGHKSPLLTGETEAWREMLEVNVLALCICTREAAKDMRANGDDGHIIHIGSLAGHRVPGTSGVYSATKFAVRSLTEGLRKELRAIGSGIRVSAISPGYVETEFAEQYHKSREKARETYGRYKVLEAGDVADAVRFVLSRPPHMQVHDILIRPTDQPT